MIGILNLEDIKKLNKRFNINIMQISGEDEDISIVLTRKGSFAEISCTIKINLPYAFKCFPNRPINKIIEEIIECSLDELGR